MPGPAAPPVAGQQQLRLQPLRQRTAGHQPERDQGTGSTTAVAGR